MSNERFRALMTATNVGPRICHLLPLETLLQFCLVCRWLRRVVALQAHTPLTLRGRSQFIALDNIVQNAIRLVDSRPFSETDEEFQSLGRIILTLNNTHTLVLRLYPPYDEYMGANNALVNDDNQSLHSGFDDFSDNGNDWQSEGQPSSPDNDDQDNLPINSENLAPLNPNSSGWHTPTSEERFSGLEGDSDEDADSESNPSCSPPPRDVYEHSGRDRTSISEDGSIQNGTHDMHEGSGGVNLDCSRSVSPSHILEAEFTEISQNRRATPSGHLHAQSERSFPTHSQSRNGSVSPETRFVQLSWADRFATLIRHGSPSSEQGGTRTTPLHMESPSPSDASSDCSADNDSLDHASRGSRESDEVISNGASSAGTWPSQVSSDSHYSELDAPASSVGISASVASDAQEWLEEVEDDGLADDVGVLSDISPIPAFRAFARNLGVLNFLVRRILARNPPQADPGFQLSDGKGNDSGPLSLIPFVNVHTLVIEPSNFCARGQLQDDASLWQYGSFPSVKRLTLYLTSDAEQYHVWEANIREIATSLAPRVETLDLKFTEWSSVNTETYEHLHQLRTDYPFQRFEHLNTVALFLDRNYILDADLEIHIPGCKVQDTAYYGQKWGRDAVEVAIRLLVDSAIQTGGICTASAAVGWNVTKPRVNHVKIYLPSKEEIAWISYLPTLLQHVRRDQVRVYGQVMVQVDVVHSKVLLFPDDRNRKNH